MAAVHPGIGVHAYVSDEERPMSVEGLFQSVLRRALAMADEGEDCRITMEGDQRYSKNFDEPAWLVREDVVQRETGTAAFTAWDPPEPHLATLSLVIEAHDLDSRRCLRGLVPMARPKPKRFPDLLRRAGELITEEVESPARMVPRYAGWDLDRFTAWARWELESRSRHADKGDLTSFAGFAFVDGARQGKRCRTRRSGDPWPSGMVASVEKLREALAERGAVADYQQPQGGAATFIAVWWSETPGVVRAVFSDPGGSQALYGSWSLQRGRGLWAAFGLGENTVTVTEDLAPAEFSIDDLL